jgi:RHS repeat-associated protein
VSACDDDDCVGSGFERVDFTYDGAGHRTAILATPASGPAVETTFRYQGDAIVAEYVDATLVREYVTDAGGTISKVIVPSGGSAGTYLVTWNGHGDAMALYRIESDGSLTLANSYTYSTWGSPTTATHNGIADLGFRFLYVGAHDVQWDASLGLHYMHARHYSPALGRFLQPDPSRLDAQLFVYAGNGPVSRVDPSGLCIACKKLGGGGKMKNLSVFGKAPKMARPAVQAPSSNGVAHTFGRHANQWFGRVVRASTHLSRWVELLNRAAGSTKTVYAQQNSTPTIGYLARIDDKYLFVQFVRTPTGPGRVLSAYVPNNVQLRAILNALYPKSGGPH